MRRNTKNPNLHLWVLPLPVHYKREERSNSLDLEDPENLQEAADEIILLLGDDLVSKLSDQECANERLMWKRVNETVLWAEDVRLQVSKLAFIFDSRFYICEYT